MTTTSTAASTVIGKSSGWSVVLSVLMILAGILAIVVPPVAGIAVTVFVAWLLVFSGAMHFVYGWHAGGTAMIWEIFLAIAYTVMGVYMLFHSYRRVAAFTFALGTYLVLESLFELMLALRLRPIPSRGWVFLDSIITLILAIMIWRTWPARTDWVIGVLVGISMLFNGVTRLMISLTARKLAYQAV
jgi:uncharacterized membrane protein HdeD (DUF308 family)